MNERIKQRFNRGFTLIELSIVIIIVGLLIAPVVQLYAQYKNQKEAAETLERMDEVQALITGFFLQNRRFPCPADPSLSRDDPLYGREINSTETVNPETCDPTLLGTAVDLNTCAMGGGICYVSGVADKDTEVGNDPVVIGSLPIITMRETMSDSNVAVASSLDGWKSNFVYAVSRNQAIASRFSYGNGVIRAENEFGDPTAGIVDDGDYVLISRGPNRIAGMSEAGEEFEACKTLLSGIENENCDPDAVFVKALRSTAAGSGYYDDYVSFGKVKNFGLWGMMPDQINIQNLNTGFVGVNTDVPEYMLDVAGTIESKNNTRVEQVCQKPDAGFPFDPASCFDVDVITGTKITCPAGTVLVSINDTNGPTVDLTQPDSAYTCKTMSFTKLTGGQSCNNLNEWIIGFKSDGEIICGIP